MSKAVRKEKPVEKTQEVKNHLNHHSQIHREKVVNHDKGPMGVM